MQNKGEKMPKLRQNPITGEWVVIAPERAKRPDDFIRPKPLPKTKVEFCNFCKGGEAWEERIKEASTEHVYVTPNKYPAFVKEPAVILDSGRIYFSQKSVGGHEIPVLVDHNKDLEEIPPSWLDELFEVYQKRINFYKKMPEVEYVMPIHNHGPEAAETVDHPHSQIFASPIIPNLVDRELLGAKKYWQKHKKCIFCEIIKEEKKIGQRLVAENKDFICFTAYAARVPFEMWVLPKKHEFQFEELDKKRRLEFAELFKTTILKLYNRLNGPAYNFYLHNAPCDPRDSKYYYHWHFEILPRVTGFGGYELGSGVYIEVVSPEKAAEFLRKATQ